MPDGFSSAARRLASPQMQQRFSTRMTEFAGLMLGIAGISLGLALITYSPLDPSWNTASNGPVRNIAGAAGADVADLLLQWFGLAGILPVLCLLAWAWRIASHRGLDPVTLRLAALFAALPVTAGVAACVAGLLGTGADGPGPAGPGGAVGGTLAAHLLSAGSGLLGPLGGGLATLVGGVLAALLVTLAFGLSGREWLGGFGLAAAAASFPARWAIGRSRPPGRLSGRAGGGTDRHVRRPAALPPTERWAIELGDPQASPPALTQEATPAAAAPALFSRRIRSRAPRRRQDEVELPPIALPDRQSAERSAPLALAPPAQPRGEAAPIPDDVAERALRGPAPRFSTPARLRRLIGGTAPPLPSPAEPRRDSDPARETLRRAAAPPPDQATWRLPPIALLRPAPAHSAVGPSPQLLEAHARLLETVLGDYGVQGQIRDIRTGPVVSLYELEPAPGIRSARVIGLADDIARSLSVTAVRIATVPGRNVIGIEIPNPKRETVLLSELLGSREFATHPSRLVLALGKDISGAPILADLARMPHLLIAGTTGSGKSVGVNAMIASLLYRLSPDECRLILIDPKMLELSVYDGIPHLMAPVVTDPKKAVTALKWTVREMERRYRSMSQLGVRNVAGYNEKAADARARGETVSRRVQTGFDSETGKPTYEEQRLDLRPLPFLVVVIDEMADLMMVAGKEIEAAVQRLAQMARAAGIHVIMATQRPSVDVITGTIKANFPTRISFQVISKFDSRTILGEQGAEQLLGQGDMLHMQAGGRIGRVHGPFVEDAEVEQIVAWLKEQGSPDYLDEITDGDDADNDPSQAGAGGKGRGADPQGNLLDETSLFDQAVAIVAREGKASTSFLQRHLSIGYNRAAKLIEQMEKEGIISLANHVGRREVLVRRTNEDD